jgi:hypothetical protein
MERVESWRKRGVGEKKSEPGVAEEKLLQWRAVLLPPEPRGVMKVVFLSPSTPCDYE